MPIRYAENKARMETQPLKLNGHALKFDGKAFKISRLK